VSITSVSPEQIPYRWRESCSLCRVLVWEERVSRAVERVGTPCYVSAFQPVAEALQRLDAVSTPVPLRPWLSYKTHPLPALAAQWLQTGFGVEVVSEAELNAMLQLGCSADQILVNGVAKHTWLAPYAIDRLRVHFDSLREVELLAGVAVQHRWRVGVRVQAPDERDARDPQFNGQFGMLPAEAVTALRRLSGIGADIQSIHFHLGQRRHEPAAYERGVERAADVCDEAGVAPRFVDVGGGLPPPHDSAIAAMLDGLSAAAQTAALRFGQLREIWVENGRFISEDSTVLAIRVVDIKLREECRYVICDGGRTNHALAADAHPHSLMTLPLRGGPETLTTVCGPTCMTDDRLGRWMLPESIAIGDVLVWLEAGAYHLPWETRFSHGLCPVVWFDASEQMTVARPRETLTMLGAAR
jgi:ornithine decarboxylase